MIPLYHALLHLFPSLRHFLHIDEDNLEPEYGSFPQSSSISNCGHNGLGWDRYAHDPKPVDVAVPLALGGGSSRTKEVYVFPRLATAVPALDEYSELPGGLTKVHAGGSRRRSLGGEHVEKTAGMWVIVEDWD